MIASKAGRVASAVAGAALLLLSHQAAAAGCASPQQMDGFKTCADVAKAKQEGAVVIYTTDPERGTAELLVLSQVVLSMQLPFAVVPLVRFVSDRRRMGGFVIPAWLAVLAWLVAAVIVVLNFKLLADSFMGL